MKPILAMHWENAADFTYCKKYYIILILWASSVSNFNCFNYRKVDHQFICLMFLLRRRKIMMGLDMQKVLFKWTFLTCTKIFTWQSMYFQCACFYDGLKNSLMRWQVVTHFFIYPSQLVISAAKVCMMLWFFLSLLMKKNCQHSVVLKLDEAVMDHILWKWWCSQWLIIL